MAVHNDCLRDVPDIFENEIGESLATRTEGLGMIRELGPPDLCHIVKAHSSNRNEPDIGSYHHVLGVDTSSSASLAAYINSLQYSLNDAPGWFGASNSWKITSGTYCSYNAFSNVDLRVQIKIPGGVDAYIVTVLGERKEVTEELWRECQVSSLLRAIMHSDPLAYNVTGLRRVTPVPTLRDEARLVDAVTQQFWSGWSLGSNAETQMISTSRNFLTDGLMRYFAGAGRYADYAAEILAPLAYAPLGGQQSPVRESMDFKGVDPEVASILAETYLEGDEEVQAVRVMHQALKIKPSCYPLLYIQAEFLRRKNQLESALTIARMAVKYAPSEFHAWAKLAEIYIDTKDFKRALLTLNACPMYTFVGRDLPRVPPPRRINYPVKSDILADYNLGEAFNNSTHGPMPSNSRSSIDSDAPGMAEEMAQNETSDILRLSAPTLNGTFAHAYRFLSSIFGVVGWDELLLLRSQVFVMEEEYRNSSVPGVAVDDEVEDDDGNDEDDDHLPLSALRERAVSESQPKDADEPNTNTEVKVEADTEDKTKADTEDKTEADTEDKADSVVKPDTETKVEEDVAIEAETETKLETEAESEVEVADVETNGHAATKPELAPSDTVADESTTEPQQQQQQSQPSAQGGKGKKKNKKNKGKKAQNKAADNVTEQTIAVEAKKDAENEGVQPETIADLGNKMEDVSLSDADGNKENAVEADEGKEDVPEEKDGEPEEPAPESPFEPVAEPQTAVLEAKEKEPTAATADNATDHNENENDNETETHVQLGGDTKAVRKRLCERWLDNLIMMLFEDLRAYTAWRSRMHNLRATGQQVTYTYTQAEWEALGELALRLHHPSEAKEAFEYALAIRFSAKAWQRLLEIYVGKYAAAQKEEQMRYEGVPAPLSLTSNDSLMMALDAVVWLSVYNDRWYNSMVYPNPVCDSVVLLVKIHGLSKVRNSLVSMNLKTPVFNLVKGYLEFAEKFEVTGSKW
ncbi:bud site selection protein [Coemansia interrupta]|uniref:Bud site selection protein n=1 Tax=Coemansia interrupta TaxID=1126814 RepID=A0A9W8LFP9_9FUNG|nr:bud site selection protein [Coemansia interrupta]